MNTLIKYINKNMRYRDFAYFSQSETVYNVISESLSNQYDDIEYTAFIIHPGRYNWNNKTYICEKEGLYRFGYLGKKMIQRVVYKDDTYVLIASLSWIISHGNKHNNLSQKKLLKKCTHSKLIMTCGFACRFCKNVLDNLNIKNRLISSITKTKLDYYDNGHTMLEVFIDDTWVLYDIDLKNYFTDTHNHKLNALQLRALVLSEKYNIIKITSSVSIQAYHVNWFFKKNDISAYLECALSNNHIKKWYKRVYDIIYIKENENKYYYYDKELNNILGIKANKYQYIKKHEFIIKYYS